MCMAPNSSTVPVVFFAWSILFNLKTPCNIILTSERLKGWFDKYRSTSIKSTQGLIKEMPEVSIRCLYKTIRGLEKSISTPLRSDPPWKYYLQNLKDFQSCLEEPFGGRWNYLEARKVLEQLESQKEQFPEDAKLLDTLCSELTLSEEKDGTYPCCINLHSRYNQFLDSFADFEYRIE